MKNELAIGGVFKFEHLRNGKIIDTWEEHNIVVDEGLNHVLDVSLSGTAQNSSWYIGLYEGNYTPLSTDTAANIGGNSTESIAYDEATRQLWVDAGATSKAITNSASKATFTINATKDLYGAFLISANAKSGTAGVLFAASKFSAARSVVATDQLLVTYEISVVSS